jgi:hypothetical protein
LRDALRPRFTVTNLLSIDGGNLQESGIEFDCDEDWWSSSACRRNPDVARRFAEQHRRF